jgi:hypothetical protein
MRSEWAQVGSATSIVICCIISLNTQLNTAWRGNISDKNTLKQSLTTMIELDC